MTFLQRQHIRRLLVIGFLGLYLSIFTIEVFSDEPTPGAIQAAIEGLGADRWADREDASQRILGWGEAALEALERASTHPDPEVRSRSRWLLSVIAPPTFRVDLLCLTPPEGENDPFSLLQPREWLTLTLENRSEGQGVTTIPGGNGRRLGVMVTGENEPYSVEVIFFSPQRPSRVSRIMQPDLPTLIVEEEEITIEDANGKTRLETRLGIWIGLLSLGKGNTQGTESLPAVERIKSVLEEKLQTETSPDPSLYSIAGKWGLLDSIASTAPTPRAPLELLAARLRGGDLRALNILDETLARHLDGIDQIPREILDPLPALLTHWGSEKGAELLLRHLPDFSYWQQHLGYAALSRQLLNPLFVENWGKRTLEAILESQSLTSLQWNDPRLANLLEELEARLPVEAFQEALMPRLTEALAADSSQSINRIRVLHRILLASIRKAPVDPEKWLAPVRELVRTLHAEEAFGIIIDSWQKGQLEEAQWKVSIEALASSLLVKDTNVLYRTRRLAERLLSSSRLEVSQRRVLLDGFLKLLESSPDPQRATLDLILSKNIGPLDEVTSRGLRTLDSPKWKKRIEKWRKAIAERPPEQLWEEPESASRKVRLTVVDIKIDDEKNTSSLIRLDQKELRVGIPLVAIGADGSDETLLLEEIQYGAVPNALRLSRAALLYPGRPHLQRLRPRWRSWSQRLTSETLGPASVASSRTVRYESLLLLGGDIPSEELLPPLSEGEEGWGQLQARLITDLGELSGADRKPHLDIITRLRLRSALNVLAELYEENQTTSLARALFSLGDDRGRFNLIKSLDSLERNASRDAITLLEELIRNGDREATEKLIGWLESPPRALTVQLPVLLRSLELVLTHRSQSGEIDEKKLRKVLVGLLDQERLIGTVIPLLRRITGQDHGYYDTLSITDVEERRRAQAEVVGLWKEWWQEQQGDPEAPEER